MMKCRLYRIGSFSAKNALLLPINILIQRCKIIITLLLLYSYTYIKYIKHSNRILDRLLSFLLVNIIS